MAKPLHIPFWLPTTVTGTQVTKVGGMNDFTHEVTEGHRQLIAQGHSYFTQEIFTKDLVYTILGDWS